uniref:Uncharacterized protein n=1 Tax=Rhizophora mucronata TaxID=61149 RepID=A0A2P2QGX7_RHIMU
MDNSFGSLLKGLLMFFMYSNATHTI